MQFRIETPSETLLRHMRDYLGQARDFEATGEVELADAAGAVAANKLARAIRVDERAAV